MPVNVTNSQAFPNFVQKLKNFSGLELKLKFFSSENCNLSGVLKKFMQLTNGVRRKAISVILWKKNILFLRHLGKIYTFLVSFEKKANC